MQNKTVILSLFTASNFNNIQWMQKHLVVLQINIVIVHLTFAWLVFCFVAIHNNQHPIIQCFVALRCIITLPPCKLYVYQLFGCSNLLEVNYNQLLCIHTIWYCRSSKYKVSIQNIIAAPTSIVAALTCMVLKLQNKNAALQHILVPLHCHSPPIFKYYKATTLYISY